MSERKIVRWSPVLDQPRLSSVLAQLNRPADALYGYCHCGCGLKTPLAKWNDHRRGQFIGEPVRYAKGGHASRCRTSVTVDLETGCWIWQKKLFKNGYGSLMVYINGSRQHILAHRMAWELAFGRIPLQYQIDHMCKETRCVNPNHLDAVSRLENVRRSCATRLNESDASQIRKLKRAGLSYRKISALLGFPAWTVRSVLEGKSWRDIV